MSSPWSETARIGRFLTTDPDLLVAKLAAGQWGVVSIDELYACGLSYKQVQVRVRQGHLHPLYRGVYATGHRNITQEGHFLAAVKACGPYAVLSHYAAAALWELVKWDGRPIDVTAPTKRSHARINAHRAATTQSTLHKGIPVTTRLQTIVDLATVTDERTLKRALRQAKFNADELAALPRRGKLKQLLATSTAATVSTLEDIVLDLVLAGGLAHPEVNAPFVLPGRIVYPDLRWPAQRVIVEADSAEWHDDPLARADDAQRQAELEAAGERVLRVTYTQATRQPKRTLAPIRAAGVPDA